jgi:hypothetical protein
MSIPQLREEILVDSLNEGFTSDASTGETCWIQSLKLGERFKDVCPKWKRSLTGFESSAYTLMGFLLLLPILCL